MGYCRIKYFLKTFVLLSILIFVSGRSIDAQNVYTWEQCLKEAQKSHPDLIAIHETIIQQKAQKTISAISEFPQVSADLNASTNQSKSSGNTKTFSYGVSGSQLLFDGLKTVNDVKAASENIKAAQENYKFTSATIRFQLREAFVNLLKAQELINLTQEIHKIRKSHLELIALRYQSGTEHRGALLTAKANMSRAVFEINQSKRGLEVAQRQLLTAMGHKDFISITVDNSLQVAGDNIESPDFKVIVKNNPELLKTTAQKNASAFNIKSSQGELWPSLYLSGDFSESDDRWPPSGSDPSTGAGLKVSLPLFEGGARLARIKANQSIYRQRIQEESSKENDLVLALSRNWSEFQDSLETVKVQENFLNAAQERSRIAEQQYSIGLISFDNWTIIEDDFVNNKKSFLNAQVNALLAEASWIQAKGETLEYEN